MNQQLFLLIGLVPLFHILSDSIHEQADLSSAGRLLALTSNDEINLLACSEYAHHGSLNAQSIKAKLNDAPLRS